MPQQLQQERHTHSCIKFGDSIIVSGGVNPQVEYRYDNLLNSTELLNVEDLTSITNANMSMKEVRSRHGLVLVHYNSEPTILAIGGISAWGTVNSIEIWHPSNTSWTISPNLKLSKPRAGFGFFPVPTRLLCSP